MGMEGIDKPFKRMECRSKTVLIKLSLVSVGLLATGFCHAWTTGDGMESILGTVDKG